LQAGDITPRPQINPHSAAIVIAVAIPPGQSRQGSDIMTTRRHFIIGAGAFAGIGFPGLRLLARAEGTLPESLRGEFSHIERDSGGRLGVAVLDTSSQAQAGHHADDRFPMCSTFKLLACAAVLKRVDDGKERLDRRIAIQGADIVPESTFIKAQAAGTDMTLAALCEAAMTYSDNTAANLIIASLGSPQAVTAYARSIGDTMTRLDRNEPSLNEAVPGDLRDTTTPSAMVKNMQTLLLGDALSAASREQLTKWMIGNKTGGTRLRAGLPAGWKVGDKTGTGERGSTNDIGIVWPPNRAPVLVAVYLTETAAPADKRNAAIAAVGRAVAGAIGG
jgi:beta-lactamase class A